MNFELNIIIRLLAASIFGAIIGVEREYRAKEAGVRTHFMVCLGSALFTVVSQFGFIGISDLNSEQVSALITSGKLDPSRVAAQIVSGIGFIGAGTIILRRRMLVGLTTAAGLWTTAAIGMASGGGLYTIATFSTVLIIAGFELLRWVSRKIGHMKREVELSFITTDSDSAFDVCKRLKKEGHTMSAYSSSRALDGRVRVKLMLDSPERISDPEKIFELFGKIKDAELEEVG